MTNRSQFDQLRQKRNFSMQNSSTLSPLALSEQPTESGTPSKTQRVHDFFDTPERYLGKDFGIRVRRRVVSDVIGKLTNQRVLDVGCGDGRISLQFAKENKISLLDLSENMLELAKGNTPDVCRSNVHFQRGDVMQLESDNAYDLILAIGVTAHVECIDAFVNKCASRLSESGRLVLQFSDYAHPLTRLRHAVFRDRHYAVNKTPREHMKQLVQSLGLRLEREVRYSLLVPGIGRFPNQLLYWWTMFTYTSPIISPFGTDLIWVLNRQLRE